MNQFRTQVHSVAVEGQWLEVELPGNPDEVKAGIKFLRDLSKKGWELRTVAGSHLGLDVIAVDYTPLNDVLYAYWGMRIPAQMWRGKGLNHEFVKAEELARREDETLLRGLNKLMVFGLNTWMKEPA